MTLSQIHYFLTVARELNVSRAAEALYVSQPAVSKQVSQLEQELGVKLFDRTNQGLVLTEAGSRFAAFFGDTEKNFRILLEQVQNESDTVHGTVRIGYAAGWDISEFYPRITEVLAAEYPKLEISIIGLALETIRKSLERGEADLVVTNESLLRGQENICSVLLTRRRGILLFSAQHPLADVPGLTLADFRDEVFYVTAPPTMREATEELLSVCSAAEFFPKIEFVPTLSTALMMLSGGHGVLLCHDWMMARNNPLFRTLPLDIERGIGIAWLADNHSALIPPVVRELRKLLRTEETGT